MANIGKSIQLESTESTVITTRSHLIFAVRECFEQTHRGDHFIFEHPSNASSWNELCIRKASARSSEAGVNVLFARSMAAVGCCFAGDERSESWWNRRNSLFEGDSKADSIGDDNVGKKQDCCELRRAPPRRWWLMTRRRMKNSCVRRSLQ